LLKNERQFFQEKIFPKTAKAVITEKNPLKNCLFRKGSHLRLEIKHANAIKKRASRRKPPDVQ